MRYFEDERKSTRSDSKGYDGTVGDRTIDLMGQGSGTR